MTRSRTCSVRAVRDTFCFWEKDIRKYCAQVEFCLLPNIVTLTLSEKSVCVGSGWLLAWTIGFFPSFLLKTKTHLSFLRKTKQNKTMLKTDVFFKHTIYMPPKYGVLMGSKFNSIFIKTQSLRNTKH